MNWTEAVNLAKDGKEEGYNFLYQETYQRSFYIALKYMKQEEAASDVLQDAYIKAFQNLDQLQDAEKFQGWFSRIVATKALDELKKKKAVPFSQTQAEDEEVGMEELLADSRIDTQPELALDQKETGRLVKEMIDTLSDEQRFCIIMFYVEEMSVKDIAQTLGVSENTVKSRLKYGRKKIEEKVLELEKKGTRLYGIAPLPFFLYLLLRDSMYAKMAQIPSGTGWQVTAPRVSGGRTGKEIASRAGKTAGTVTVKKAIIGVLAGIVVCGSVAAAVYYYAESQNTDMQETVSEVRPKTVQEELRDSIGMSETETETGETEISINDNWKNAYSAFAADLQGDGNGYAFLEVDGSEIPLMVVMPDVLNQTVDLTGLPVEDFESEEAYNDFLRAFSPMQPVSEDSCIYLGCYQVELYYYDTDTDEIKRITNAEGGTNGALIDPYMEIGFYLTYLPDEQLLAGDLVGSSIGIETYCFDAASGKLKAVNLYLNETTDDVNRKDIIYYRKAEEGIENINSVQR